MAVRAGAVARGARGTSHGGAPAAAERLLPPRKPRVRKETEESPAVEQPRQRSRRQEAPATTRCGRGRPRGDVEERLAAWRGLLGTAEGHMTLSEQLLKVRTKRGALTPLAANAVQQAYERRRGQENLVLKARQMGMSTWVAGQLLLRCLLVPGTVALQVAHTREAAMGLFRTVQRMHTHLPLALREHDGKAGLKNQGAMSFPAIDSEFRIASAGEMNAGRGLTVTHMHLSEVARWQGDAAERLAGLRAALAPEGELVLESTPNGAYGCFFSEWQTAERRGAVRHFFPWWLEPGYVAGAATELTEEELQLVAVHGLSAEQVGFRRGLRERYGPMAGQEFAEDAVSCFRESGRCYFEAAAVAERLRAVAAARWVAGVAVERRWNDALRVWWPAVAGRRYVIGADPAGGGEDGDWSAAQVVDAATGRQCAELQAKWGPRLFAERLAALAREYGGAELVVERNNHGAAVLAYLEAERGLRLYRARDGQTGLLTTVQSRADMLAKLGVLLSTRAGLFESERLLEECRTFVVKDGGRTEAAAGAHDDLVMAMAVALRGGER